MSWLNDMQECLWDYKDNKYSGVCIPWGDSPALGPTPAPTLPLLTLLLVSGDDDVDIVSVFESLCDCSPLSFCSELLIAPVSLLVGVPLPSESELPLFVKLLSSKLRTLVR